MSCHCIRSDPSDDHVKEEPSDNECSSKELDKGQVCAFSSQELNKSQVCAFSSHELNKSQVCAISSQELNKSQICTCSSQELNKSHICTFPSQESKKCDFTPEEAQECQICVFYPEEAHETHKTTCVQRQISTMYDSRTYSQRTDECPSSSSSERSINRSDEDTHECQTSFSTEEKQNCKTTNVENNPKNKDLSSGLCHNVSVEIEIEPEACMKKESKEYQDNPPTRPYMGPQEIRPSTAQRKFKDGFCRNGEMNQPPLFGASPNPDMVQETPVQRATLCNKFDKPINIKVEVNMEIRPKCNNEEQKTDRETTAERDCEKLRSLKNEELPIQTKNLEPESGDVECETPDWRRQSETQRAPRQSKRSEAKRRQSECRDAPMQSETPREREPSKKRESPGSPRKTCKKCRCQNGANRCRSNMDPKVDRCRRCCDCAAKKRVLSNAEKQMIFNVYDNLLNETGNELMSRPKKDDCCAEIAKAMGISKTCVCAILEGINDKETDTEAK